MRNYRLFRVINFRFACAKNFKSFSANVQSIWDMHLIYNLLNQIISLNSKNWQNICWEDFATAFFETLTPTFANKYNLFVKFGLFIFAITYSRVNFWENLEKMVKKNVLKIGQKCVWYGNRTPGIQKNRLFCHLMASCRSRARF